MFPLYLTVIASPLTLLFFLLPPGLHASSVELGIVSHSFFSMNWIPYKGGLAKLWMLYNEVYT